MAHTNAMVSALNIAGSKIRIANDIKESDNWTTSAVGCSSAELAGVESFCSALAGLGNGDDFPTWMTEKYIAGTGRFPDSSSLQDSGTCEILRANVVRFVRGLVSSAARNHFFIGVPGGSCGLSSPSQLYRSAIEQSVPHGTNVTLVSEQRAALVGYLKLEPSTSQRRPQYAFYTLIHLDSAKTDVTTFEAIQSSQETSTIHSESQMVLDRLFTEICWMGGDSHIRFVARLLQGRPRSSIDSRTGICETEPPDVKFAASTIDAWSHSTPPTPFPGVVPGRTGNTPAAQASQTLFDSKQRIEQARMEMIGRGLVRVQRIVDAKRPGIPTDLDHVFIIHGDDKNILSLRWKVRECLRHHFDSRVNVKFADVESGQYHLVMQGLCILARKSLISVALDADTRFRSPVRSTIEPQTEHPQVPSSVLTEERPASGPEDDLGLCQADLKVVKIIQDENISRNALKAKAPTYFSQKGYLLSHQRHIVMLKDRDGRFLLDDDERSFLVDDRYHDVTENGIVRRAQAGERTAKDGDGAGMVSSGSKTLKRSRRHAPEPNEERSDVPGGESGDESALFTLPASSSRTSLKQQAKERTQRRWELRARTQCAIIRAIAADHIAWFDGDSRRQAIDQLLREAVPPLAHVPLSGTEELHDHKSLVASAANLINWKKMPGLVSYKFEDLCYLRLDLEHVRKVEQALNLQDGELTQLVVNHPGRLPLPQSRTAGSEVTGDTIAVSSKRRKIDHPARRTRAKATTSRRQKARAVTAKDACEAPTPDREVESERDFGSASGSLSPMSTSSNEDLAQWQHPSAQKRTHGHIGRNASLDAQSASINSDDCGEDTDAANSLLRATVYDGEPRGRRRSTVPSMSTATSRLNGQSGVALASRVERVNADQGDEDVRVYRRLD
ncbi:hypothetical protein LTS10_011998 [Elasticomyces elasticus]|nr:hypothetical protein LTS10_011998 [Elasticomyces elasticus]